MDDTHPGLREILNKGAFSVRRTEHHFSRLPVDLTLEQTINADAACRLTGITSFTNDYSARLRWMITKATRASFITLLQEMTGLINKEDVTPELSESKANSACKIARVVTVCNLNSHYEPYITARSSQLLKKNIFGLFLNLVCTDLAI